MRRLFIIRKDLNLTPGKMGAQVGHCAEAYWTNFLKAGKIRDLEFATLPVETPNDPNYWEKYRSVKIYNLAKAAHERGEKTFQAPEENPLPYYYLSQLIDKRTWDDYVNGIFTKTICEAKNLNELKKAESKAKELKLVEGCDWGFINDCCLTELKPENPDGTTTIGIWFKPLEDDIAHQISKKFKLYGCFDRKRNCDVYRTYDEARKAYMESHPVTDMNETMMKWLFDPYQEKKNEEEATK